MTVRRFHSGWGVGLYATLVGVLLGVPSAECGQTNTLKVGDSRERVVAVLGQPIGTSGDSMDESLLYRTGWVDLSDGRVTAVRLHWTQSSSGFVSGRVARSGMPGLPRADPAQGNPGRAPPPSRGIVVTGILVDSDRNPVASQKLYLYKVTSGKNQRVDVYKDLKYGTIANPSGVTDAYGRFQIRAPAGVTKGHSTYAVGMEIPNPKGESKTSLIRQDGEILLLRLAASTADGRRFDIGSVVAK